MALALLCLAKGTVSPMLRSQPVAPLPEAPKSA
jgi:hypothetical protein